MPDCQQSNTSRSARQDAYALRAKTRWLTSSSRERGCGYWPVTHVEDDPYIEVKREKGQAVARWCGLLQCGHIWTCPVCSQKKRAQRARLFDAAIRGLGGRWQMVTVTLRHRNGMSLRALHGGLMKAWRRARQGGRVQRIWSDLVTASARAVEMPHGENGWHVHLHVVLRTQEWSDDDREALLSAYRAAIRRELGVACIPDDEHALFWSDPFDGSDEHERGSYLSKLSLEVSGFAKVGKRGSVTHWEIARRAGEGDQAALRLWHEYYEATKGRRCFELDERAATAGREQLLDDAFKEAENADDAQPDGEPLRIRVKSRDLMLLRRLEREGSPGIMAQVLRSAETDGIDAVARWVAYAHARAPCPSSSRPMSKPFTSQSRANLMV